jgi:hypothetical protein
MDLMKPFGDGHYYHKAMGRSYSIKKVVTAILGYDPYEKLNLIRSGDEAMTTFPILHKKELQEIESLREALIAYCTLDTQAMVWVLNELYRAAGRF